MTLKQIYDKLTNDSRFSEYQIYEKLFLGDHFGAFSIKSDDFKNDYAKLRYLVANFAGLVSKVITDMLFGEPVTIKDDKNQDVVDAIVFENSLDTLFYEHAMANSYFGDNIFKIRVENNKLIIGDTPPALYIPELDSSDVKAKPKRIHLAWIHTVNKDEQYLVVETHEPPLVKVQVGQIIKGEVTTTTVEAFNKKAGTSYVESVDTKINRFLIKHVANWKTRGHFGISDFVDLKPLLFALNNRLTKSDNILDKHSDPILAVPEGVIDQEGNVRKEAFNMFEMDEKGNKPEYIVWNANLESAFKEIDQLVDFLFMFSETSPDAVGKGTNGAAESGRALKMRLLRTIAKRNRKKLYYDQAIKDLIFTAELLLQANPEFFISEDFKTLKVKEARLPQTIWQDGVVNDEIERTETVIKKIEGGIMSKKQGIMSLENIEADEAEKIMKEIKDEDASFTSFVDNSNMDKTNKGDSKNQKKNDSKE